MEKDVPYAVFESTQARADRRFSRLIAIILVLIFIVCATNLSWIIYEFQFEDITVTQDASDGINNYVNGGGSIDGTTDY